MKKISFAVLALAAVFAGTAFSQTDSLSEPDASNIGNDSARQALREVSVDRFEREGSWNVHISSDNGVITGRLFEGSPAAKEELNDSGNQQIEDTKVLGVKVEFFRRGVNSFYITAQRPIAIEGVTKTVSVWVCGRNQGHDMYLLVEDYFGRNYELYMGNLGFSGWKKLTCVVPPSPDSEHGIVQRSPYYGNKPGLRIIGFRVDCNPMLARGTYYMYLDDLRCVTDLYDLENQDVDDMSDAW